MKKSRDNLAIQFGAGNIGRGFMGQLLRESGFEMVFVDVRKSLVNDLNTRGSYPLRLLDAYSQRACELTIDHFRALNADQEDAVAEAIANAHVAATAVGVANLAAVSPLLAAGIRRRQERSAPPRFAMTVRRTPAPCGCRA